LIKVLFGNSFEKVNELEDNSIDCVISSPPYFGLRDYGNDNQMGLEKHYKDYIQNTVNLFRLMKPKLKDQATIWWNVGDSYYNYRPTRNKEGLYKSPDYHKQTISSNRQDLPTKGSKRGIVFEDIKEKDLMMIPNRVAIALQEDGWYVRSEIIWHKPNPMPESVRDRPTSCHEKIWLITKNKSYYYDHEAIKEEAKTSPVLRNKMAEGYQADYPNGKRFSEGERVWGAEKKNKRNVWSVTTKPFKGAHFATFPPDLIEPCILAGCPEKVCANCDEPYINKPIYKYISKTSSKGNKHGKYGNQEIESANRQGLHSNRGNKLIEVRDNLPKQSIFVNFLRSKTNAKTLAENTNIKLTKIEHWFRSDKLGFAYPSIDDWKQVRDFVDDWSKEFAEIDNSLMTYELKSDAVESKKLIGYELKKQCDCQTNETKSGTVLDPFGGSGTTGLVAHRHKRNAILIELNREYKEVMKLRFSKEGALLLQVQYE